MVKKAGLLLALVLGLSHPALSQVTTSAVPFLLIAPNSRAGGMGESGAAIADDVWAWFWNPAGYAFQQGSEIGLSHANWLPGFGLSDLWIAHLAYKMPVEEIDGTIATAITYLNLGEFNRRDAANNDLGTFKGYEFAVTAGYSTRLSEETGLGINGRFIYSRLAPFGTELEQGSGIASGFAFDAGFMWRPHMIPFTDVDLSQRFSLGINISNIGPNLTYIDEAQADPLPMNFRLGLGYIYPIDDYNSFSLNFELNKLLVHRDSTGTDPFYKAFFTSWTQGSFSDIIRSFGVEYWYGAPKLIALRFGYFYEDPSAGNRKFWTFGAGIRHDIFGFDFSYIAGEENHPLSETLRFSLLITWGGVSP